MGRFEVGTLRDGVFEADTIANKPDLTTFETEEAAISEASTVLRFGHRSPMANA
jgi:hypothetical protein